MSSAPTQFPRLGIERDFFRTLAQQTFSHLISHEREALTLQLSGEDTHYLRFNGARVRQTGTVRQTTLTATFQLRDTPQSPIREAVLSVELSGDIKTDALLIRDLMPNLRTLAQSVPANPHSAWPGPPEESEENHSGQTLSLEEAPRVLLAPARGLDFTGIHAAGIVLRAVATSTGIFHWFTTELTSIDYSVVASSGRAIKDTWAGRRFDSDSYIKKIQAARALLPILEQAPRQVPRGEHRTFLAPAAVADLIAMFSWGTIGEGPIRQGDSALAKIRTGEVPGFSPLFSLREDFTTGSVPRFNGRGELAPSTLALFEQGRFTHALVNTRSAREYQVAGNQANEGESLRAPVMQGGQLPFAQASEALGTGLWLSNLHYLNWSDQQSGRITGMTRHACLWVEDGKPVAPIENLRFDDTLFRLLGSELEALTCEMEAQPETGTYAERQLGSCITPGALLKAMRYTL